MIESNKNKKKPVRSIVVYMLMTEKTEILLMFSFQKKSDFLLNFSRKEGIRNVQPLKEKREAPGHFVTVCM